MAGGSGSNLPIKINFGYDTTFNKIRDIVKDVQGVINRATNRAAYKVRTVLTQETAYKYFIKPGVIRSHMKVFTAQGNDKTAKILFSGRELNLAKFYNVQPKRPGYKGIYKGAVLREGGLKPFRRPTAFYRRGKGLYLRNPDNHKDIWLVKGPAVPQIVKNKYTVEEAMGDGLIEFKNRLQHEIHREIQKSLKVKGGRQMLIQF